MGYFEDVYSKRVNRYGLDYQSRVQGQREKLFQDLLLKSIYKIDFDYNGEEFQGIFEKYKQNETQNLHYLLTELDLNIPNGTILELPNKDNKLFHWMVYYLEDINASGYNRYIMLKMTHHLTWEGKDGESHDAWAYFYGQQDNMLKDELQARSRSNARYIENLKTSFFITPKNANIKKDNYLVIDKDTEFEEAYVVTGYDIRSSEGIEYVTVDPVYIRDESPDPAPEEDNPEENFWLNGGV